MSQPPRFDVEVERAIPFGTAFVNFNEGAGPFRDRPLLLDVYKPTGLEQPAPALIMAFGGAFHRGTREDDRRPEETPVNTNIADYCARFAARGYVCFSIDYRLTQEDSHPGFTPTMGPEPVPTSRIDVVRKILGLPPATSDMLKRSQEGAIDDIVTAYRFVSGEARALGVDPARIGVGGFSAGGRIAVTAALAEAISPAAVVALSGVAAPSIVDRFHASGKRRMPVFLAYGEHDLDYVIPGVEAMVARFDAAAHPYQCCRLPGQSHFYEAGAEVVATLGQPESLEAAIEQFLAEHL
ncbi:MAG: alpha/beta hydrolase [Pseudomonadota bacterium]